MGRKGGGLYINPKKIGALAEPCAKEMISLLNCMARNNNDGNCGNQKKLLGTCMTAAQAGKKKKSWGSINYHLQRLSTLRK